MGERYRLAGYSGGDIGFSRFTVTEFHSQWIKLRYCRLLGGMVLTRIDPITKFVGGDKKAALNWIGVAQTQMKILKHHMSFQNLEVGIRRRWINKDVYIECVKSGHYQACHVWVRPGTIQEKPKVKSIIISALPVIVFSTQSGAEAVAWDIETDALVEFDKGFNLGLKISFGTIDEVEESLRGISPREGLAITEKGDIAQELYPLDIDGSILKEAVPTETIDLDTLVPIPETNVDLGYGFPIGYSGAPYGTMRPIGGEWREPSPINPNVGQPYFNFNLACFVNDDWVRGDSIVFQTFAGSNDLIVLNVDTTYGTFDSTKLTGNALGAIDEVWTIWLLREEAVYTWHYFCIIGTSTGPVYDFAIPEMLMSMPYPRDGWIYTHDYIEPTSINYIENVDVGALKNQYCIAYFWAWWKDAVGQDGSVEFMKSEFESKTGLPWPTLNQNPSYWQTANLKFIFFNPVFGVSLKDGSAYWSQMVTATTSSVVQPDGIVNNLDVIYDSWTDAAWSEEQLYPDSEENGWVMRGLAQKPTVEMICDAYTFCAKINSDSNVCNNYEESFRSGMHIFYRKVGPGSYGSQTLHNLINEKRLENDLNPLIICPNLQAAAERHAQDMAENGFCDHEGSDGSSVGDRVISSDYFLHTNVIYQSYGYAENIAAVNLAQNEGLCETIGPGGEVIYSEENGCSLSTVVNGWMESPGHEANILYEDFTDTGIGIGKNTETGITYICQIFGFRVDKWPGFGPFNTDNLQTFIDENFTWDADGDETRLPKIYLAERRSYI